MNFGRNNRNNSIIQEHKKMSKTPTFTLNEYNKKQYNYCKKDNINLDLDINKDKDINKDMEFNKMDLKQKLQMKSNPNATD